MPQTIHINNPEKIEKEVSYPNFIFKEIVLNDKEYIIKGVRKHWVVFRDPFLVGFFIPLVLIFLSFFISTPFLGLPEIISSKFSIAPIYLVPVFFLIGFFIFIVKLYLWYRTFYLITNERIIKIEQESIFSSKIHQMYLEKIQDAICKIPGLQATLYGYGDISIQGSSETAQITFMTVAKPKQLQQLIAKQAGNTISIQGSRNRDWDR